MLRNTLKTRTLRMLCTLLVLALGFTGVLAGTPALAFDPASPAPVNIDEAGVGLRGYDPVAYFSLGVATPGDPKFATEHDGVTYHFANAEHMARFKADPAGYAPQFGGFCQFGVALAKKLDGDPTVWRVADGKLFVYAYPDAKTAFLKDIPGNTVKADETWPEIMDKAPRDL